MRERTFLKVMDYLSENDNEQNTVSDLVQKMKEFGCCDPYSIKYMRKKIEEHFGSDVIITNINGRSSVVTFKQTASAVLHEFYDSPKLSDCDDEKLRMVRTVGNLIKNDIKSLDTSKQTYPNSQDISSVENNISLLPDSLYLLLKTLFSEKNADIKIASIGQAIVQATRPRVILAPLQIGLAVQMHHQFASKFLIDTLHSQGFCSSYSEVKRFEVCAAKTHGTDIPGLQAGHFIQYVADNADHNINTIDGYNTFHGMGIIAAITPGVRNKLHIQRHFASNEEIEEIGKIDIKFFKSSPLASLPLTYHELGDLSCDDTTWKVDFLWKIVWPLRSPRPGWAGLMQTVTKGQYPGKSSISYMPMIDMNATDMSCVYSTLHFVCTQAKAQNVTPIITFDQPLWWKAQIIVQNEPVNSELKNIVLRLGGFHTEMSYLGCIGHIMRGSGLQELMEVVYAPTTVMHMLSGKALSRAVRGHFLINAALNALLVQKAFSIHHTVAKHDLSSETDAEQICQSEQSTTPDSDPQQPSHDAEQICQSEQSTTSDSDHVSRKYQNPVIVFDGYETGPSTKDVAHMRRSRGMVAPEVIFVEDMPVATRKDHFLANPSNKQRFINMLSKKLEETGFKTVHARGDADLLIVQTAVESASSYPTTVIGEDTDLLVLLCFHAEPTSLGLYFMSEGKKMMKKQRVWNITELKVNIGSEICNYLPFVHAAGGCDTTSRLFGIGKGVVLKKLIKDSYFREHVHQFCTDQVKENIMSAGETIIVCLYNGLPGEKLDSLRYQRFSEKVATSSSYVQVHTLPPTSAAARYHNAHVYLQVKEWIGDSSSMDPEDWGWIKVADKLEPRTTDKPPAPDTLLRVIRCNCKTECDSRRCTCRRHGLECSVACGQCRGVACSNAMCNLTDMVSGDN